MKLPKDIVLAFTMFKIHYFEMMHQDIYLVIEGAGLYISCRFKDGTAFFTLLPTLILWKKAE